MVKRSKRPNWPAHVTGDDVLAAKATAPTTVEGIEKYLGSGMIRGIGPVYAKKLVRAFGETVFEVIPAIHKKMHGG